jgi:hypothetical protein
MASAIQFHVEGLLEAAEPMNLPPLSELFPDSNFEFSMRLRPGDPLEFFKPTPDSASILRERARWLEHAPGRCVVLDPNHRGLIAPLLDFAAATRREQGLSPFRFRGRIPFANSVSAGSPIFWLSLPIHPAGSFCARVVSAFLPAGRRRRNSACRWKRFTGWCPA